MKLKNKISAVLVLMIALFTAIPASAESVTNDGLTTEIIADNNFYQSGETAKIVVKITNNNDFAVSNVSVESIVPEGLELVGDSTINLASIDLEAGKSEKITMEVTQPVESTNESEVSSDTSNENNNESVSESKTDSISEVKNDGSSKDSSTSNTAAPVSNNNNGGNNNSNGSSAKTGDKEISVSIALVVLIGATLVICIVGRRKKKLSKVLSLAICGTMISTFVAQGKVAAENVQNTFEVKESLRFDQTSYEIRAITAYDSIAADTTKTYTRGEWIKLIADIENISTDGVEANAVTYFYGDTEDTEDGLLYEIAYSRGLIPQADNEGYVDPEQDIPMFEADKLVTREFAAYSAVKALGFVDQKTDELICSDAENITYKTEVAIALKFNLLKLINGAFEPNTLINEADKNQIIASMKALDETVVADDDEIAHKVNFIDGVISEPVSDLNSYKAVLNSDNTYTVTMPLNETTKAFAKDTVFVLPANNEFTSGLALKVTSLTKNSKNVILNCVVPKMEEVVMSMYMKDNVALDPTKFIPAEGVSVKIKDSAEQSGDAAPLDISHDFQHLPELALTKEFKIPLNNGKELPLTVGLEFSVPNVSVAYKSHIDWDWFNSKYVVDEMLFAITTQEKLNFSVGNEKDFLENADNFVEKEFTLGSIPVALPAGFKITVEVGFKVSINGEVSIGYHLSQTAGIQQINGQTRKISDNESGFDSLEIEASLEAGPTLSAGIGWTVLPDLIGVELFLGVGVKGNLTPHLDANLYCFDASIYLALSISMTDDCAVATCLKLVNIELSWDIFDEENSPLKLKRHFEGFHMVDECTYGDGSLEVTVSGKDDQPLKYAKVVVKDTGGSEVGSGYTGSDGKVVIDNLSVGQVTVEIKATGYKKYISGNKFIEPSGHTTMEAVLMLIREDDQDSEDPDDPTQVENGRKNTVSGVVTDALTGRTTDSSFVVKKGANATDESETIYEGTTTNGSYNVLLPYDYYTIIFKKDGYIDSSVIVTVKGSKPTVRNVTISPELSDFDRNAALRIVLTWGATPYDLDSHLFGYGSSNYRVWYSQKQAYANGVLKANLDVDDTTSYGPETTTIQNIQPGETFKYYVKDYSNGESTSSMAMSNSGARVAVYSGDSLVGLYYVPTNISGGVWHVFDYDPNNGAIIPINTVRKDWQ